MTYKCYNLIVSDHLRNFKRFCVCLYYRAFSNVFISIANVLNKASSIKFPAKIVKLFLLFRTDHQAEEADKILSSFNDLINYISNEIPLFLDILGDLYVISVSWGTIETIYKKKIFLHYMVFINF